MLGEKGIFHFMQYTVSITSYLARFHLQDDCSYRDERVTLHSRSSVSCKFHEIL